MAYYIKQNLQTAKLNSKGTLSEVNLFHSMMETFRFCYGATVIVSETHQNYVGFDAIHPLNGQLYNDVTREISDLHIITYSPSRVIARETFLQAKVANGKNGLQTNGTFCFSGDWRQYDLLSRRPALKFPLKKKPYYLCYHPHLDYLQQAVLPSIGSYGVFYRNKNNEVDFAYQPADKLICNGIKNKEAQFTLNTLCNKLNVPHIPDLQYSLSVDEFEKEIISMHVGSPITLKHYTPYFPIWHPWAYMHWPHLIHDLQLKNSDAAEVDFTIERLVHFMDFIHENRRQFFEDGRDGIDSLRRYFDDEHIPEENHQGNMDESPRHFEDGRERRRLCHGATSLVLINVDNIKK